jgi:hypothetical protein
LKENPIDHFHLISQRLIVLREEWEYFHQVDELLAPIAHVESELTQSFGKKIKPLNLSLIIESPRSMLVFESLWVASLDPSFRIPRSHP